MKKGGQFVIDCSPRGARYEQLKTRGGNERRFQKVQFLSISKQMSQKGSKWSHRFVFEKDYASCMSRTLSQKFKPPMCHKLVNITDHVFLWSFGLVSTFVYCCTAFWSHNCIGDLFLFPLFHQKIRLFFENTFIEFSTNVLIACVGSTR